jgi:hypothetical protein
MAELTVFEPCVIEHEEQINHRASWREHMVPSFVVFLCVLLFWEIIIGEERA